MNKFLISLLLFSQCCFSQSLTDYNIYSSIINSRLNDWKISKTSRAEIVITENLTAFSQRIDLEEYAEIFAGDDKNLLYVTTNYKDSLVKLSSDEEFKELFKRFASNYNKPRNLAPESFNLPCDIKIVSSERIQNLFSIIKPKTFDKAWKKFYKQYPNSLGYFELSNIEYSDNYALIYLVHRAKPLIGSGQLIIMKKMNNNWQIYESLNMWME